MNARLLVSIVNWNSSAATNDCLNSIARLAPAQQPDILVIDNDSRLEELVIDNEVKSKLRHLNVRQNDQNLGFAGAHNQALQLAHSKGYKALMLLNNDTVVIQPEVFEKLFEALFMESDIAAAAPTILRSQNPDIIWFGGGVSSKVFGFTEHSRVDETYDSSAAQDIQSVSFLTGCALMIRVEDTKLDDILLPEVYFLYWEDSEWSYRARARGQKLLYVPDGLILHNVSASLGSRSATYYHYIIRNNLLFVKRNIPAYFWISSYSRLVYISLLISLKALLGKLDRQVLGIIGRAWFEGLAGRGGKLGSK